MSPIKNNIENKKLGKKALTLTLMPSIFAAGCCAVAPIAFMFGFASSEFLFPNYALIMRIGGVILLTISLVWFFYSHGIVDKKTFEKNKTIVIIIIVQTIIVTLLLYLFLTQLAVPAIWTNVLQQTGACCGL